MGRAATAAEIAALEPGYRFLMFSDDGRQILLAVPGPTGQPALATCDTKTGQILHLFKGHSVGISAARFFADGKRLLSGSQDRTAKIWDTETGRELLSFNHATPVQDVAISSDNKRILTVTEDGKVTIRSALAWNSKREHPR